MHDKILDYGFIWDTCDHSVDGFAAQVVHRRICLYFCDALLDCFDDFIHFADVIWHYSHVDGFRIGLLLDVQSSLFERICKFVATECLATERNYSGIRLCLKLKLIVFLDKLYHFLNLNEHLFGYFCKALDSKVE